MVTAARERLHVTPFGPHFAHDAGLQDRPPGGDVGRPVRAGAPTAAALDACRGGRCRERIAELRDSDFDGADSRGAEEPPAIDVASPVNPTTEVRA